MGKEKDELRDSDSQFKHCINDLQVSIASLKEAFISCHSAEITLNQTRSLTLQVAKLQPKLSFQPHKVPAGTVKVLTEK